MKARLEFDLPEDELAFDLAANGAKYKYTLDDVWERVFRPNNKHGYNDELLDSEEAYDIIEKLIAIYLEVVDEV